MKGDVILLTDFTGFSSCTTSENGSSVALNYYYTKVSQEKTGNLKSDDFDYNGYGEFVELIENY